ncbi:predicted protein [Uncinocarpus reesii 1704]|uniref:C2H2-type domain-containing protein n=1 Tax=Uncinocarpus reesii (strain UAMH 1704) TaxID=336963 RepID=C4JQV5_UNCRE|nr:uncharacterized protein UREG_03437 [Uncinocarpus reesii 1704]EEP78591.1 predicted protein [Uncinocarpus reesii 1704]
MSSLLKNCMYSSGRLGEYLESTARYGTGRGLYIPESLTILVIRNGQGRPEIIVAPKRDAKNMSNRKTKHPRHPMPEVIESLPIYLDPVPGAAALWSRTATRGTTPFCEAISEDGPTGKILTAAWFTHQLPALGRRAGYNENIRTHDIRAEALVKADENGYSPDQRMQFGGHSDPRIFFNDYMSSVSSVQGVGNILNLTLRDDISQHFRGLLMRRHPQMWQSLPAKLRQDLEGGGGRSAASDAERQDSKIERQSVYVQKYKLIAQELEKWQSRQARERKPGVDADTENDYTITSHWRWFERASHLMPERKRLSTMLFLPVPLRSPEGRQVLLDMVALCRQRSNVSDHPALVAGEMTAALQLSVRLLSKSWSPSHDLGQWKKANQILACVLTRLPKRERWRHIYQCRRARLRRQHGFAGVCFICFEWFTSAVEFEQHCQHHLSHPETIPMDHGYLEVSGMLAWPAYCPRCLGDTGLPCSRRLKAFTNQQSFQRHMEKHYTELHGLKSIQCGSPHCDSVYSSVQELQCHYDDTHSIPAPTRRAEIGSRASQPAPKSCPSGTIHVYECFERGIMQKLGRSRPVFGV